MKNEAIPFIQSIWRAARSERRPRVGTDSPRLDSDVIARVIQGANLWLTPAIVKPYTAAAFDDRNGEVQKRLSEAVERFREVASRVPGDQAPTLEQLQEGRAAFDQLKAATGEVIHEEWKQAANALVDRAEKWATESGRMPRRKAKSLKETLIGSYELDQLWFYAEGSLYILDPVARFIPDGLGSFDLSIQPSFSYATIYRHLNGEWHIFSDVGRGVNATRKEPLTRGSFQRAIVELRALV